MYNNNSTSTNPLTFCGCIVFSLVVLSLVTCLCVSSLGRLVGGIIPPGVPSGTTNSIVGNALTLVPYLRKGPPNNYYVSYDNSIPQNYLTYWQKICPNCASWKNGNLQCGMFVSAAYGLAGYNLEDVQTVIQWWGVYAHRSGWIEISDGTALPAAGDILILDSPFFNGEGHAGIVVDVKPPQGNTGGTITFANANAPSPLVTQVLEPNYKLDTWKNYTVKGYLRMSLHQNFS